MNHICQQCSKNFLSPRPFAKFCSHECYGKSLIGSDKGGRTNSNCKHCGKFFSFLTYTEQEFCSHECYSDSLIGKKYHTKCLTEKTCPNCNKTFFVSPSKTKTLCCNKQCKDEFYFGKNHKSFNGYGEIGLSYFKTLITRAFKTGKRKLPKEFSITIEELWERFLKQNRQCALTGIELTFGKKQTASLDRIDSDKGYIPGNIQWVHKDLNIMKNNFNTEKFLGYCKLVCENFSKNPLTRNDI